MSEVDPEPTSPPPQVAGEVPDYGGDNIDYTNRFVGPQKFPTVQAAIEWAREVALSIGFFLTIASHKPRTNGRVDTYLCCDRYMKKVERDLETAERRHTKRKGVNCPFKLRLFETGSLWFVRVVKGGGTHNHPLMVYQLGHRQICNLSPAGKKMVGDMTDAQVKPGRIMAAIKIQLPELNPNMRHIYNCREWLKRKKSQGRNPMQQFIALAVEYKYLFWLDSDDESKVVRTFVAHPTSIKLLRTYPQVLLLDATYKTNRYKYPMVEVVGVTPTNMNFLVGWGLLKRETEADYRWLLMTLHNLIGSRVKPNVIVTDRELGLFKPISEVFPESAHFLCLWHVNRDVELWVRRHTKDAATTKRFCYGSWKRLVESTSEEAYVKHWDELISRWYWIGEENEQAAKKARDEGRPTAIHTYLEKTWLRYKEKFVKAWTNRVRHYGNTSNCRVESQHSYVKEWIRSSTSSCDTLFEKMHAAIGVQHIEIMNSLEHCRRSHDTEFDNILTYVHLQGRMSFYALRKLRDEIANIKLWDYEVWRCECVFKTTHGMPCACSTFKLLEEDRGVYLEEVDPFWRTLIIGDGVDIPQFEEEAEQDAQFFRSLVDKVTASDPSVMRAISRIMHSRLHPHTDDFEAVEEPEANVNTRGAPRHSKSTMLRGRRSSRSTSRAGRSGSRSTTQDLQSGDGSVLSGFPYRDNVPAMILDYIVDWLDVVNDGNCGFRCVADAVANGQENWDQIRRALVNELVANPFMYHSIYGGVDEVGAAAARIEWEGGGCGPDHYMEVVADLFPIATHWRCAVMCFWVNPNTSDPSWSVTVLPLTTGGRHSRPMMELTIVHLGTYHHYIRLHLDNGFPVPPISPLWYYHHDRSVDGWDALYTTRRARWDALVG